MNRSRGCVCVSGDFNQLCKSGDLMADPVRGLLSVCTGVCWHLSVLVCSGVCLYVVVCVSVYQCVSW